MGDQLLAAELLRAATIVEKQLDDELSAMGSEKLDLEELRRKRMLEIQQAQKQKQELLKNGHGKLDELSDEKEFFEAMKKSSMVVCHFYDTTNLKSAVLDKHLEKLAAKHFRTRFVRANSEKVPFLIKRLNIRRIPTIGVCMDQKMVDFIRVADEFGASDDFKLEAVEQRLGQSGVIELGEKLPKKKPGHFGLKKVTKTIRDRKDSGSDDADDWQ